jgi:hypothetical protein
MKRPTSPTVVDVGVRRSSMGEGLSGTRGRQPSAPEPSGVSASTYPAARVQEDRWTGDPFACSKADKIFRRAEARGRGDATSGIPRGAPIRQAPCVTCERIKMPKRGELTFFLKKLTARIKSYKPEFTPSVYLCS